MSDRVHHCRTGEARTGVLSDEVVDAARLHAGWACRRIFEELAPAVAGYLRSRGVREVEDVTSDVFLAVFQRLPRFEGGGAELRSFVFTIAHHRAVDDLRRRGRAPEATPLDEASDPRQVASAETSALEQLGTERVHAALDALAPDQREVLLLRVVGDLTLEQTATALGKSTGAVKQLQRRGLAALARLVESGAVTL